MTLQPFKKRETWLDPFQELEREMNFLFSRGLGRELADAAWSPAIDVLESKDRIAVKADLPGMNKEDIEVSVQGDTLIIKGEKKQEKEVKEGGRIRSERTYGSFYRAVTLPEGADASNVKATYKNGVLELILQKKEEVKPKQISIEVK